MIRFSKHLNSIEDLCHAVSIRSVCWTGFWLIFILCWFILPPPLSYSEVFQYNPSSLPDPISLDARRNTKKVESKIESPDEPLKLSIKNAILMALQNNHTIMIEQLNPLIQKTFEEQERSSFDPAISGEVSRSRERSQGDPNADSVTIINQSNFSATISEFFPTGTRMDIGMNGSRTWSDLYGDQHSTRIGLTVTQALLKGGGLKVNLASLRQARFDTFSSHQEFRGFAENLISQVEETYWEYALANQRIEIFRESLNLAEKQLKETEERIKIGVMPEIELAAAQAEVALRKEDLINAKSNLAKVRLRLLRLINPAGPNIWGREIELLDQPVVPEIELDMVDAHVEVGLLMRSDLNQARFQLQKGDMEIVKTKNGLLPKMDFFISLGKSGYSDSFGGSIEDPDRKIYDIQAGIQLDFPLFNRNAKARHQRALLSRAQADEAVNNLAQLVQLDIRSAYIEVERTNEQVSATAATRRLQEEKMRAEIEKFRVGKSTSLLVAQAQRDLLASRISEIEAVVSYLNAMVELYRLEGALLERRGIDISEP